MQFQNCSILLLEEKHLPISVQCLFIVLFIFSLTVFSQNRFPKRIRSALPSAPFISVMPDIVVRLGSFVTVCIWFWGPPWHSSWFKNFLCTLMFIVCDAKHYGFWQKHGVMCPPPSYGRNGCLYLYVDLHRASASMWSFVSCSLHLKLLVNFIHAVVCNYSHILSFSTMIHYLNKSLFIHSTMAAIWAMSSVRLVK